MNYLELLDRLARAYPHWAGVSISELSGLQSFRMMEPIVFSGENQIVAIVELPKSEYRVLHLLYGEVPQQFVVDYLSRMAQSLIVFKDGIEVAQYGH